MAKVTVLLRLQGLAAFKGKLLEVAGSPAGGPLRDAWLQVATRYRAFIQERFTAFSRGEGNWPPLAESTIKARTRAPVARFLASLKKGPTLTAKQYAKRLATAKKKAANHWNKHLNGEARFSILIDTGVLFASLAPIFVQAPGQYQEEIAGGIKVGIGGPAQHPNGKATIADIATFHQTGGGNLPQRKIIVPPPEVVKKSMVMYLERGMKRLIHK